MAKVLNIAGLGFDVVVMGGNEKTEEIIGEMLEKKIATLVEDDEEDGEPAGCRHCGNVQYRGCTC